MKKAIVAVQEYKWSFHVLVAGIVLSLGFYMYCINAAVRNVVVRNTTLDTVSELQAQVSELETEYIAASNGMTLDTAAAMGLSAPENKLFISKTQPNTLSINR